MVVGTGTVRVIHSCSGVEKNAFYAIIICGEMVYVNKGEGMKKTPILLVAAYLLISCMVAVGFYFAEGTEVEGTEVEGTEAWNPVESVLLIETEQEESVLTPIVFVTQENSQVTVPEVTGAAESTVTPMAEPVVTATLSGEETSVEKEEIANETTPTAKPTPFSKEEDAVLPEENRVNVTYNGKVIGYYNTDYRMEEETLKSIVGMVRKAPYISSFVLYDMNSDAMICYNEKKYFPVASTVKAPFAMTCLWQIEEGLYSIEDTMEYTSEYKVRGDGVIKKEDMGTMYTIKELVEHSITVSDDIGYLMLQGYFGHEKYNEFLKGLGNRVTIDGGNIKWGQTSTLDSLRNWQEIYRYINSDGENAAFFADLLKNTNKSYIRNVLGEEYVIYNKMGWVYDQCCHDHAIIMDEQPYLMMIMTMGDVRAENQKFMEDLAVLLNGVHEEMVAE